MEALFEIISQIISFVNGQVADALKADVGHRVFAKAGDIQNAVTNNLQERYGNLEDQISQAALIQYQDQLQAETEKKVLAGNLVSLIVAIIIIVVVIVLMYWITKSKK